MKAVGFGRGRTGLVYDVLSVCYCQTQTLLRCAMSILPDCDSKYQAYLPEKVSLLCAHTELVETF